MNPDKKEALHLYNCQTVLMMMSSSKYRINVMETMKKQSILSPRRTLKMNGDPERFLLFGDSSFATPATIFNSASSISLLPLLVVFQVVCAF
jgi:hypothetical protein